jgi:hypothetical protein
MERTEPTVIEMAARIRAAIGFDRLGRYGLEGILSVQRQDGDAKFLKRQK